MPTPTTTYSLSKPTVGGDDNAWGTELNNNLDKLDDLLDGTLSIAPNLVGWQVGGVAVTSTAAELNILDGVTASTAEINILDGVTATTAELNYVDGVTSNIQTQLNAKQPLDADLTAIAALTPTADRVIIGNGTTWTTAELPSGGILAVNASAPLASSGGTSPTISLSGTVAVANGGTGATTASGARTNLGAQATITGGATTITSSNLTTSRALVSDGSGKVAVSAVTSTEVGYLAGVTSSIQTQINNITAGQVNITGAASTIVTDNLTANRAVISDASGKVAISPVTSTELGRLDGVTSNVQTQLNAKQATITGGATTITSSNLTTSRALVSDGSGKVAVSAVTSTEVGYLDGVTSNIQTQLNGKASTTTQLTSAWQAGTSTTETIVSPAKVKAAIDALVPVSPIKAWVKFNGTGTPAIAASLNVSSITDNGTGDYTVNFTSALADTNFAVVATIAGTDPNRQATIRSTTSLGSGTRTTSSVRILTGIASTGSLLDAEDINVIVVR